MRTILICALYSYAHYTHMCTILKCALYSYVHFTHMRTILICALYSYVHYTHMCTIFHKMWYFLFQINERGIRNMYTFSVVTSIVSKNSKNVLFDLV